MKTSIIAIVLTISLMSCSKNKTVCIARNADGTAITEMTGKEFCEDQISPEDGQYCDCQE